MTGIFLASLLWPFSFTVNSETRTAYQSRGKIAEDRPLQVIRVSGEIDTVYAGHFGVWNWNGSSLTDRRRSTRRNWFHEMDFGVYWKYAITFDDAQQWKLVTTAHRVWITNHGYTDANRRSKIDSSIHEWRLEEALENPYVTPFLLFRRGHNAKDWTYWNVGLRKRLPFLESFYFTPSYSIELGDARIMSQRYGERVDGAPYSAGAMASNLRLELGWDISEEVMVFIQIHQFDVISSPARRAIKASTAYYSHRDLTIGMVGLRLSF